MVIQNKQTNINEDDDNKTKTDDGEPRKRKTRRSTNQVEPLDDQTPPLRRSSRIRNRKEKVANASANPTTDRKIEQTTEVVRKKEKADNAIVSSSSSSLTEHANITGHTIDWAQVRILWGDQIPHRLLVKESLIIQAHQPRLNRTTHSVPLLIYPEGIDRKLVPNPHL